MPNQTAVEWLIDYVHSDLYQKSFGQTYISVELVQQALAMEKEQIVDAFKSGEYNSVEYFDAKNPKQECSENYYNETYKGGQQ